MVVASVNNDRSGDAYTLPQILEKYLRIAACGTRVADCRATEEFTQLKFFHLDFQERPSPRAEALEQIAIVHHAYPDV